MKTTIINLVGCICLIYGCRQSTTNENKSTVEQHKNSFESFLDDFSQKELPVTIDSSFMEEVQMKVKDSKPLDEVERSFVKIEESTELHDQQTKYLFYPLSKLRISNNWGLLFFAKLNPEIPFDATIFKVWLGIYSTEGVLLSTQEVGLVDLQYGIEKRVFSNIKTEGIELIITVNQEDFDTGEIQRQISSKIMKIKGGKIQEL